MDNETGTARINDGTPGDKNSPTTGANDHDTGDWNGFMERAAALPPGPGAASALLLADIVASSMPESAFKSLAAAIANATKLDKDVLKKELARARTALSVSDAPDDGDEGSIDYEPAEPAAPLKHLADRASIAFQKWIDTKTEHLDLTVLWAIGSWGLLPGCKSRQYARHGGVYFYPYIWLTSVDAGSGKTTLLRSLNAIARRPLPIGRITPAALFRDLAERQRTGLVDEVGDLFGAFPEIAGLLEMACYRDGSVKLTELVTKAGRESRVTKEFLLFSAIAMASVERNDRASLRSTLRSRSIRLRMIPSHSKDFKPLTLEQHARAVGLVAEVLGPHFKAHADAIRGAMEAGPATPLPSFLKNRARDVWVHFFAIAELLGGDWPARCLAACRLLSLPDKSPVVSDARDAIDAMQACQQERGANYAAVAAHLATGGRWQDAVLPYPNNRGIYPHNTKGAGYDPDISLGFLPTLNFIDWLTTNGGAVFACANAGPAGRPITPKRLSVLLSDVVVTEAYAKRTGSGSRVQVKGWFILKLEKVWAEEVPNN